MGSEGINFPKNEQINGGRRKGGPTPFCSFTLYIYCVHTADWKNNFSKHYIEERFSWSINEVSRLYKTTI